MNQSLEETVKKLEEYSNELTMIHERLENLSGWGFARVLHREILLWKDRMELFLQKNDFRLGYKNFSALEKPRSENVRELRYKVQDYLGYINALIKELKRHPDEIMALQREELPLDSTDTIRNSQSFKGTKVFIVHGHDKGNFHELKDLLKDRYKLECIIMKFQAGKGRTLIEKFEQEAGDAGFAFILMTPDDLVEIPGKKEQYAQARPNVIFELGWFHGKLGRDRVCIVFKKGTKIHSDLDGVSRIEFTDSIEEKVIEIERELRAAGLIK